MMSVGAFGPRLRSAASRLALAAVLGLGLGLPGTRAEAQQGPPAASPGRDLTVQNETDLTLRELYLFLPNAVDRGSDRLGTDLVAPGATFRLRLARTRDCQWNVVAVFQDGSEEARQRVDLCRNTRLVFGDPSLPTVQAIVANRSQVVLRELYAARPTPEGTSRPGWGPDRLGASVIEPGESFTLRMRTRDCVFDLRAVYADDREEVKERQDLCANRNLAFDRSGIPRPPLRGVILANRHLARVQEVYLSASTDSDWGPDRLGSGTLAVGQDAAVEMEGDCEADLRIVFPNGGAEERREVNLCETQRIVLRPGWVLAEHLDEEASVLPEPATSPGSIRLRNLGPLPIVEIYTNPPGGSRGEDRLGADVLPTGEVLELDPPDPDACRSDLVAVFRDGREVAREGVDLCSGEEIELR